MKKFTRLKLALATISLTMLGACSPSMYTFAPNTGTYHNNQPEQETATVITPEKNSSPEMATATALAKPEATVQVTETEKAGQALAQNQVSAASPEKIKTASENNSKNARQSLKQARKDLKQLKKDIKDGKDVKIDATVKLLIILGLIFLLLGIIAPVLGYIGVVLIVIGLVLLLMGTL